VRAKCGHGATWTTGELAQLRRILVEEKTAIPHLFVATNRFPTGQRGLFAIWRTGGGVTAANALRYLEVK
jgi:predicted phage gp36 major capsid-like protein